MSEFTGQERTEALDALDALDDRDYRGEVVTRYGHPYPCDCEWCSRSERHADQLAAFRREI